MDKGLLKKRLAIFLLFSFGLVWGMQAVTYMAGVRYGDSAGSVVLAYAMLCPVLAMLITRLITKQGFGGMKMGISLRGKKKYYILAFLVPLFYTEAGCVLYFLLIKDGADWSFPAFGQLERGLWWLVPAAALTNALIVSFGGFGEEAGWRGYMYPMLKELFGAKTGIIIGGVIWGIWHYPMIYQGHNYGTGYFGYPFTGFLVFTVFTVAMGAWLDELCQKTDSVWAPAFAHAVNNAIMGNTILSGALNTAEGSFYDRNRMAAMGILCIPACVMGLLILFQNGDLKTGQKKTG